QCYEGFPRVVAEAFATGTPVVASRLGAMAEIVDHGRTGLHFKPGDPNDLAAKVRQLLADHSQTDRMREAARGDYEQKYTVTANYRILLGIYEQVLAGASEPKRVGRCALDVTPDVSCFCASTAESQAAQVP